MVPGAAPAVEAQAQSAWAAGHGVQVGLGDRFGQRDRAPQVTFGAVGARLVVRTSTLVSPA